MHNTHNGHPESNWASVSARCVTSASAEERIHEPRYRESLDVDLQDEVGVGEGGGRQGEVSRQPRGYIALPGCPRVLTFSSLAREFLHAAADVQPRTYATPASRFLSALVFARPPLSGYKRATEKARFSELECESRDLTRHLYLWQIYLYSIQSC